MDILLGLLFVGIVVSVILHKRHPEWIEKIKSWIK